MTANEILGVGPNASEEEIRAAYLRKVAEFPPERAPEEFEKIRDAYDAVRDPRKRALAMLLDASFSAPLASMTGNQKARRVFAGPHLWREVLKTK